MQRAWGGWQSALRRGTIVTVPSHEWVLPAASVAWNCFAQSSEPFQTMRSIARFKISDFYAQDTSEQGKDAFCRDDYKQLAASGIGQRTVCPPLPTSTVSWCSTMAVSSKTAGTANCSPWTAPIIACGPARPGVFFPATPLPAPHTQEPVFTPRHSGGRSRRRIAASGAERNIDPGGHRGLRACLRSSP